MKDEDPNSTFNEILDIAKNEYKDKFVGSWRLCYLPKGQNNLVLIPPNDKLITYLNKNVTTFYWQLPRERTSSDVSLPIQSQSTYPSHTSTITSPSQTTLESGSITEAENHSNVVSNCVIIILSIILFTLYIKNFGKIDNSMNELITIYLSSLIIIICMLLGVIIRGFTEPSVWERFLGIIVICAVGPILYFVAVFAIIIVFFIPVGLPLMFWDEITGSHLFENVGDKVGIVSYIVMVIAEWIMCFCFLNSENK
ncbi:MAG: hypothetical protein ISS14_05575 [Actinobacteria bacterium]|nr:hypothetical protein [Actinomycetota bacterium]